jgi:hypothetical protein
VKGRTELPGIVEGQNLVHSTSMPRAGPSDTFLRGPDYLQGKVKVDEYVTHGYKLAEINDGFEAMHVNDRLLVSGSCLTVFSRAAIASVLSSTCHEFRRKGGEKKLVVLAIEYECSGMQRRCSETILSTTTVGGIHHTDRANRLSINGALLEFHSRNRLIA